MRRDELGMAIEVRWVVDGRLCVVVGLVGRGVVVRKHKQSAL